MLEQHYTPVEVSKALKVHPRTIYRRIESGKISAVKIGNSYRIKATELQRILDAKNPRL